MAVTDLQYQAALARIAALEQAVSNIFQAIPALVTNNQLNQLRMLDDATQEDLVSRVEGLESQLDLIVNDPT